MKETIYAKQVMLINKQSDIFLEQLGINLCAKGTLNRSAARAIQKGKPIGVSLSKSNSRFSLFRNILPALKVTPEKHQTIKGTKRMVRTKTMMLRLKLIAGLFFKIAATERPIDMPKANTRFQNLSLESHFGFCDMVFGLIAPGFALWVKELT